MVLNDEKRWKRFISFLWDILKLSNRIHYRRYLFVFIRGISHIIVSQQLNMFDWLGESELVHIVIRTDTNTHISFCGEPELNFILCPTRKKIFTTCRGKRGGWKGSNFKLTFHNMRRIHFLLATNITFTSYYFNTAKWTKNRLLLVWLVFITIYIFDIFIKINAGQILCGCVGIEAL